MADDDERGPAPDPWDEIVADGLGEGFGEETLPFEAADAESGTPVEPPPDGAAGASDDFAAAGSEGDGIEAASIEDWLTEGDGETDAGSPVLSVFAPDEPAAPGQSSIDIGTGTSGIGDDGEPGDLGDATGGEAFSGVSEADEAGADAWAGIEAVPVGTAASDEAVAPFDLGDGAAAAGAAATLAVTPATGGHARKPAGKSRGLGQLAGIVLGGILALPITLAILLFFGLDPLGLAWLVPSSLRPGKPPPPAAVVAAPVEPAPIADVPAVPEPAEPMVEEAPAVAADAVPVVDEPVPAGDDPVPMAPAGEVVAAAPAEPPQLEPEPVSMPEPVAMPEPVEPAPPPDAVVVAEPVPDTVVSAPPADPVPAPAPQPVLDTVALDEAVGEAAALSEALGTVDDRKDRAYTLLRTRWYRALARVAEELVALEHAAAAAGRPLDAPPENVVLLHGTIGSRDELAAELAALAPEWLAYAKRGSDGVVLPVTLEFARRVGPYWTTRATVADAVGQPRTITLISRSEPAGVPGEKLVVTGVALDGGVIWAADFRGSTAGGDEPPGL